MTATSAYGGHPDMRVAARNWKSQSVKNVPEDCADEQNLLHGEGAWKGHADPGSRD